MESENGFGVGFIEYDDKIPSEAKLITWKPEDCKESRATEIDEEEPQPPQKSTNRDVVCFFFYITYISNIYLQSSLKKIIESTVKI